MQRLCYYATYHIKSRKDWSVIFGAQSQFCFFDGCGVSCLLGLFLKCVSVSFLR